MAIFTNQATLSYNGNVVTSNIVTGELVEALSAVKTAVLPTYGTGEGITYIISLVNAGATPLVGLTLVDDLGAYPFGTGTLVPLDYVAGSIKYYVNGVLQPAPAVTAGPPLTVGGVSVPAGGNTVLVYEATPNEFAPLGPSGSVTNTATLQGTGLVTPVTAEETVIAGDGGGLRILKSLEPSVVTQGDPLTYTIIAENYSSTPILAADNAVLSDTFSPILLQPTVTYNGLPWTENVQYVYNEATGAFSTVPGFVTVPAATYTQNPVTGAWSVVPGVATLTVTGTLSLA